MLSKKDSENILIYFKDSNNFIKDIRAFINKNLNSSLEQETNKVIKENFFPDDKIIRELYNEVFACYYSNLHNASLSISMELLEYMTRKLYSRIFPTKSPENNWSVILAKLIKHFDNKHKLVDKEIIQEIDKYREKVRNAQNHGNITQLVEENSIFYHNVINVLTGANVKISLRYKKEIHGESNFLKAKDEIQNQGTNSSLFLINSFIVHFFIQQEK